MQVKNIKQLSLVFTLLFSGALFSAPITTTVSSIPVRNNPVAASVPVTTQTTVIPATPAPLTTQTTVIPAAQVPLTTTNVTVTPPPDVNAATTTVTTVTKQKVIPRNQSLGNVQTYEELQETMLDSAPPSKPPTAEEQEAFNALMKQITPLSPQQIIRLHQLIDASQRAASIPATVPPKPVSTTLMMNLAPGTTPPAIRLAKGYVSALVFVDSTGAPWPIASYINGDPRNSNIQWDGKSNVLLIQATMPYGDSDLVVNLTGLMTPLTLELVSGQRVVDYRTDIHVSGIGPNTKVVPTGTPLPESANQILLSVLDGIAPSGSKLLKIRGGDCQGWLLGDTMYLRTRLTLLSPGWIGRMVSPDGMNAYQLQRSSSILVSQYGQPIELRVEGF